MEYDYTRILQQKHKIYTYKGIPIPLAKNGVTVQQLIVIGSVFLVLILLGIFAYMQGVSSLVTLIKKGWLIMMVLTGVVIWTLFSLNWDQKSFFNYLLDRFRFKKNTYKQYEHGQLVEIPLDCTVKYEMERR
ncbi:TcpE family conjugal transfer membrane protein [Listeria immobilis]|uniref:TcpE family conjugal transfer membrane protein n=1 Tax=Listeria immobilis TaxID=2713502 RepID=UPI00164CE99E|nr:TcpE family conjugal transfer membrane protein [Listeria immobilis]MBC6304246.1 conjugal transfer protein [Listeria immobilis]